MDSNCSNASQATVWAPIYFYLLCLVYMLPALYRPALGNSYSIRDYPFDRCLVVFVIILCFISVVFGGWSTASGGVGGGVSFLQFLWFSRVVPLRGAASVK